ncbi:MAG: DUF4105 domain-containing protein [Myxococcales bacterium]|nr:DUF4105 domain-containing protein [Myxococcales bacterium]HIK85095.1 DUF4105 domain-containing protein [Myxococcales bacterium]
MRLVRTLVTMIAVVFSIWAASAIWIDGPLSVWILAPILGGFLVTSVGLFLVVKRRIPSLIPNQPYSLFAIFAGGVPSLCVLVWWLNIPASNDRDWIDEVERPPRVEIIGDRLRIENVRNFDYRTGEDYTPRWETREYDLSQLRGVDLFLSTWGSPLIAHTIASWDFGDDQHLAISIETRKEIGEEYSAVLGFFRQYELYYVVADERDVVRVRTNFRGEDVRLYHLETKPAVAREILLDYIKEINQLTLEPTWYNALTHNCTTNIRHHVQHVAPSGGLMDWRVLVNGRLDELGYERGNVDTSLPFETLRETSRISERAKIAPTDSSFTAWIREGLPGEHD